MHSFLPAVSKGDHKNKDLSGMHFSRTHTHTRFLKEPVCVCVYTHIYIMDWIVYFNIDDVKNDDKR